MARRYEQILALIEKVKPQTIVEVGVHKGLRAAMMCRKALEFHEEITYIGFDVFDTVDEQFHKDALNGKGIPSEVEAGLRLETLGPAVTWFLVKGDTRQTLHGRTDYKADLVFIDGDHRLEVIRGDYEPFKDAACVVLDDYYGLGDSKNFDLTRYGCNGLVYDLLDADRKVDILPIADTTNAGVYTKLAVVWK
jgi:Methyltransferase domain